jgi:hypothetical protein
MARIVTRAVVRAVIDGIFSKLWMGPIRIPPALPLIGRGAQPSGMAFDTPKLYKSLSGPPSSLRSSLRPSLRLGFRWGSVRALLGATDYVVRIYR